MGREDWRKRESKTMKMIMIMIMKMMKRLCKFEDDEPFAVWKHIKLRWL